MQSYARLELGFARERAKHEAQLRSLLVSRGFNVAHVSCRLSEGGPRLEYGPFREVFDLRPAAIVRDLDLLRPIYAKTAAYGHFGRELPDFTWERTDRVGALQAAALA